MVSIDAHGGVSGLQESYARAVPTSRATGIAILVDVALIGVFAAMGRASHDEGITIGGVSAVAAPFAVGWLVAAAILRLDRDPMSVRRSAGVWALGIPLGLVVRGAFGGGLAPAFVVVALLATALLTLGWRAAVRASLGLARRS